MNEAGYKAIKEKAYELIAQNPELLDCYNRDLYVHDKATLAADDAPKHFYWSVGVTGTYFGRPQHIYSMITSGWRSGNIRNHFYFDGTVLHDITADTIDEIIKKWRDADYK